MTEPKFTKGPWVVEPHGETYALYSRRTASEHGLRLMNLDDGDYNYAANRRLISAAPDLYEALIEARACLISFTEGATDYTVAKIDVALAKADGGGE